MAKQWIDIGSDVNWTDYGGRWARKVAPGRYLVIRFENCAEWGDGASGYHVSLDEVDVGSANDETIERARSYVGADEYEANTGEPLPEIGLVEALHSYGAKAPLWQESGTNAHKLMRAAKHEARTLASDAAEYEARMSRPVNKIGSTAREYQAGDTRSAILRGLEAGDPTADLMARLGMLR